MQEICKSGSEGGGTEINRSSLPLSLHFVLLRVSGVSGLALLPFQPALLLGFQAVVVLPDRRRLRHNRLWWRLCTAPLADFLLIGPQESNGRFRSYVALFEFSLDLANGRQLCQPALIVELGNDQINRRNFHIVVGWALLPVFMRLATRRGRCMHRTRDLGG